MRLTIRIPAATSLTSPLTIALLAAGTLIAGMMITALTPARAASVDLALVLLNDVSKSIDDAEFDMVKAGYRAAFSDPEIIDAVRASNGGIAITYVEFSGKNEIVSVQGWRVLSDANSTRAFGEAVAAAPRSSAGNTALAASLREAIHLLTNGDIESPRKVIDIASDHATDFGRSAAVRDAAVEAGITINALPIIDNQPLGTIDGRMTYSADSARPGGIVNFYRRDIIGGAGSFVVEVRDYNAFAAALKRKLLKELLLASN